MTKIATEVQTDEVTSLYKTKNIEYQTDGRRGFWGGGDKKNYAGFAQRNLEGSLGHPSKKMAEKKRILAQDKVWIDNKSLEMLFVALLPLRIEI